MVQSLVVSVWPRPCFAKPKSDNTNIVEPSLLFAVNVTFAVTSLSAITIIIALATRGATVAGVVGCFLVRNVI